MGSSDKYLMFLWNLTQVIKLSENHDKITEVTIVHPIFEVSDSKANIVTVPYLRGFAYHDNITIVYTAIGCHKIGGLLVAVELPNENISSFLGSIGSTIIAVNDISLDFFSRVRIKVDSIESQVSCKIERSPVHVPLGNPEFISAKETSYEDYDAYSSITRLIAAILSKEIKVNTNEREEAKSNDIVRNQKLNILIYTKQNSGYRIDKRRVGKDIEVSVDEEDLRERIKELFITKPKKLKI